MATTRACFDECPPIHAWNTGGVGILGVYGVYSGGSPLFIVGSDLSATSVPYVQFYCPVNNDVAPMVWTSDNFTTISTWDIKAGTITPIASLENSDIAPSSAYYDHQQNVVYSLPYWLEPQQMKLNIWDLKTNVARGIYFSDQMMQVVGFAYSQTLQTAFVLSFNSSIYAIDQNTGNLNLFVDASSNQVHYASNSLVVDNVGNAFYFEAQDDSSNKSLVKIDLKTKAVTAVSISGTVGAYLIPITGS